MNEKMDQPTPQNSQLLSDPDEINLLEYIYVLVKNKWWIISAVILGLVLGYVAAIVKGPKYVAEAVIAAKENESSKSPNLSSFGALSGLVASQLNISANPGLDKIDLILGSRKFGAELVEKYNLLPMIIKMQNPKAYQKYYDTTRNDWNDSFVKPNMLLVGAGLSGFLKKQINSNNTMKLMIESKDSTFSDTLLSKYLEYLNIYIKANVLADAQENVSYLEKQLVTVADPLLREKLQTLIANELEKQMVVSKEAFKIVDPAIRTLQFKQKKLYPVVFAIGFSFISVLIILVLYVLSNSQKTDKELIKSIKSSLLKL
jgi:LPS O-antigen subunit length determinant protein (WzzB/FepE family)